MFRILAVSILSLAYSQNLVSQGRVKTLQSEPSYWTGNIHDTVTIKVDIKKPEKFDYKARFVSGKYLVLRKNVKGRKDFPFSYQMKGNDLVIGYKMNDTMMNNIYRIDSKDGNQYQLKFIRKTQIFTERHDTLTDGFLSLYKHGKIRSVFGMDNLIIYSKLSDTNETIERITGEFYKQRGDSLFIDTERWVSEYYSITGKDTVPRIQTVLRLHNVTKIYHERSALNGITGWAAGFSLLSALIVSPLVSIEKGGFNSDRYLNVTGASLASLTLFITLRVTLSHKKIILQPGRRAWKQV